MAKVHLSLRLHVSNVEVCSSDEGSGVFSLTGVYGFITNLILKINSESNVVLNANNLNFVVGVGDVSYHGRQMHNRQLSSTAKSNVAVQACVRDYLLMSATVYLDCFIDCVESLCSQELIELVFSKCHLSFCGGVINRYHIKLTQYEDYQIDSGLMYEQALASLSSIPHSAYIMMDGSLFGLTDFKTALMFKMLYEPLYYGSVLDSSYTNRYRGINAITAMTLSGYRQLGEVVSDSNSFYKNGVKHEEFLYAEAISSPVVFIKCSVLKSFISYLESDSPNSFFYNNNQYEICFIGVNKNETVFLRNNIEKILERIMNYKKDRADVSIIDFCGLSGNVEASKKVLHKMHDKTIEFINSIRELDSLTFSPTINGSLVAGHNNYVFKIQNTVQTTNNN